MGKGRQIAVAAVVGASALIPVLAPAAGGAVGGAGGESLGSPGQQCHAIKDYKRVRRWAWVPATRRVHGHRVVIRRHGRVVRVHRRVWRTRTVLHLVCTPVPAPTLAPPAPPSPLAPTLLPAVQAANPPPQRSIDVVVPVVTGTPQVGQTLTSSSGAWSGSPTSFGYQWLRCDSAGANCGPITLATSARYSIVAADVAHRLRAEVTAWNAVGPSAPALSAATAPVAALAQPPASLVPPAITGTAREGALLSHTDGKWSNGPTSEADQWLRCNTSGTGCQAISGASGETYAPTVADVGHTLELQETASNGAGPSAPASSTPSEVVTAAPKAPTNVNPPTISGTPVQGQTLDASPGSWTSSPSGFSYQWLRCDGAGANCASIPLATTAAYALVEADVGSALRVAVVASNAAGQSAPTSSAPTEIVTAAPKAPTNVSPPTISGTTQEGLTVAAAHGTWTNSPTEYSYAWSRCGPSGTGCEAIPAAASSTFTLGEADVGHTLRVTVVASNSAGPSAPSRSAPTEVVTAAPEAPTNVSPPTISGTAVQGQTLDASPGSWTSSPSGFSYQWLRCDAAGANCVSIPLATGAIYAVVEPDVGSTLRVAVVASNAAGNSTPATSAPTEVVTAAPQAPTNVTPPTISGTAVQGQTLDASAGSWTSSPTAFSYQWLRCGAAGGNCAPIALATTASYAVVEADVGHTLRVAVVASNAAGPSAAVRSTPTEVVSAAPQAPTNVSPPTISGTAAQGQTLDASPGSWTSSPSGFSYQWLRCDPAGANCAPIALATSASYVVVEPDVGSTLRVAVVASNAVGPSTPARSAPSEVVTPEAPTNVSPPTISGAATQGQTLDASPGSWTSSPSGFSYQWLRCDAAGANCSSIPLATTAAYAVVEPDVGRTLRVAVVASDAGGDSAPATSAPTEVVTAASKVPANTNPPQITGSAQQGKTLGASTGSWTNSPESFSYRWIRCDAHGESCAAITGATTRGYTLTAADVGATLRVRVSASNAFGESPSASSVPSAVVGSSAGISHLEYVFEDGVISVYDIDHEQKLVKTISLAQTAAGIRGMAVYPPTHRLFIFYGGDGGPFGRGSVLAYDLVKEEVVWTVHMQTGIDSGAVSPDGTKLYVPTGENDESGVWNVLDSTTGAIIATIQGGAGAHNTIASADGRYVYLGGRNHNYLDVYDTATGKVHEVGPLQSGVRPFTVNADNTVAFTTATNFDGFQVSSLVTNKVLFTVSFGAVPPEFPASAPSHGASLSPDERQLYVIDAVHKEVQVWDVARVSEGVAPTRLGTIAVSGLLNGSESTCAYECQKGGWLQHTLDGRYVYVGDSGEVIDTATREVVTTLSTLANTKKSMEIDWQGGVPIASTQRTGVGYAE